MRSNARNRKKESRDGVYYNKSFCEVKNYKALLITSVYSYSITPTQYTRDNRTNMSSQQFFENMDLSNVPKEFICEIW